MKPSVRIALVAVALVAAAIPTPAIGIQATTPAATGDAGLHGSGGKGLGIISNFADRSGKQVRLQVGAFDPLKSARPVTKGISLVNEATLPAGTPQYFLTQVEGGQFAGAEAAIGAAGGSIDGVLADDTYLVRATPAQRSLFATTSAIRWTGFYQPAWRVPVATPTAGVPGVMDVSGPQLYRVYSFRHDPDAKTLAARLSAIRGVRVMSDGGVTVDVAATAAQVPAMASIPFVQWVTLRPGFVVMNKDARWVMDTGVRDLYWVSAPNGVTPSRLNGAGQTAGDADTALNYIPDQNGRAQADVRDCSDPAGTVCKVADYTQTTPGADDVLTTTNNHNATPHRKMSAYFDIGKSGVNPPDPDAHGTHTSGTVTGDAGVYGQYDGEDGIAPAARLVFQNISTPDGGLVLPSDYYQLFRGAYHPSNPNSVTEGAIDPTSNGSVATGGSNPCNCANPGNSYVPTEDARTHNNSYGTALPVSLGEATSLDQFVWDHEDMSIAVAAGNAGPDAGTIGADPGAAKNDFTSGATSNGRQPMVSIDSLTNFSSHGPTPDGRFGITVVDPGEVLTSAKGGTTDGYHYAQGTSMSTPALTGALTLMRQYFWDGFGPADGKGFPTGVRNAENQHNPSAALLKAAVVNGAERLRGHYTGDDGGTAEAQLRGQYPSAGQGFGRVNLSNSLYFQNDPENDWYHDVYRADNEAFPVSGGAPVTRTYQIKVTNASVPLMVSLAYTDAPNALGSGTPSLVNNLDLTVTAPDGTTKYVGNNFNTRATPSADDAVTPSGPAQADTVNNVEKVRIPSPTVGTYTVEVRGSSIAAGPQGFALAAHGDIADAASETATFTPGPGRQHDTKTDAPTISNVQATPVSADLVKVTFTTDSPSTATATGTVKDAEHTFTDVYTLGSDSYFGVQTGPVETAPGKTGSPVVSTSHEIYLTGFDPGVERTFSLAATNMAGDKASSASVTFTTPDNVFQPQAPDQGQLSSPATTGFQWTTGKQFYAGTIDGSANLGAFMFRLPASIDPATITGAQVQLTGAHDWVSNENDDSVFTVDLLSDAVKANWGTQDYNTIHSAPAAAKVPPETAAHRGGGETFDYTFPCTAVDALKASLSTVSNGQRSAPFRWDTFSPDSHGVWSAEFGFNRRSKGIEYRPKLLITTSTSKAQPPFTPCDPNAAAPTIKDIGIHPGTTAGTMTVNWRTDVLSDSLVLFRRKGDTAWTQVGTPARTTNHQVQVLGIDPGQDYEFGVRSAGCNGATTTDDNHGAGYQWYFPPPPQPTTAYWFHGTPDDQANRVAGPPYTATFDQTPPTGTVPVVQTTAPFANTDLAGNPLAVFWKASVSNLTLDGDISFDWWWSMSDPSALAPNGVIDIQVYADQDPNTLEGTLLGSAQANLIGLSNTPTEMHSKVSVKGTATSSLLIQVSAPFINGGQTLRVAYDATSTPSGFGLPVGAAPAWQGPHPTVGPYPPLSAGASSLNLAAVPTNATPTDADKAAGTGLCTPAPASTGGDGGGGTVTPPGGGSNPGSTPGSGPAPGPTPEGYRLAATDGGVFSFGDAKFRGSLGGIKLASPIVGMASTPSGDGYWLVGSDGGVFAFGDAKFRGSMGGMQLNAPIVAMAATPAGQGYWLVARDGGVFSFGDATFHGSTASTKLRQPIVGIATSPSGGGYWMVASDGGVFAFGDARYRGGAAAQPLRSPVVGMAATPDGGGYWLVASDGGVFTYGNARFRGAAAGQKLKAPVVGMATTDSGNGYWLVGSDGGVFTYGDGGFHGSTGGISLRAPMTGMAAA